MSPSTRRAARPSQRAPEIGEIKAALLQPLIIMLLSPESRSTLLLMNRRVAKRAHALRDTAGG
jgi:hypothetical protein